MTADRGSSEAVGTIFALLTLVLFAGASLPAIGVLTDVAATGQERQLATHAQRLSAELQTVDRLARRSESPGRIARRVTLPDRVGGQRYTVTIHSGPGAHTVRLETASRSVRAEARFVSDTPVTPLTVTGGDLTVVRGNGSTVITIVSTADP